MLSEKEMGLLYETLLSAPGMTDAVKLDLRISRKEILLLSRVIASGLLAKPDEGLSGLLKVAGKDSADMLHRISDELLEKAGLSEMNRHLISLQVPGK